MTRGLGIAVAFVWPSGVVVTGGWASCSDITARSQYKIVYEQRVETGPENRLQDYIQVGLKEILIYKLLLNFDACIN